MKLYVRKREFIFTQPQIFATCHASTIAAFGDGLLCAAWFGGSGEGEKDVAIYAAVRGADGRWSNPSVAADCADASCWNPVLFYDGVQLVLFFKTGETVSTWQTFFVTSTDGICWTSPQELVPGDTSGGRGPVKNKPIRLANGDLLAPASVETELPLWDCFTDRSSDNGVTWERSPFVPFEHEETGGIIQPTLFQMCDGTVGMLMRSSHGKIFRSVSKDGGRMWSAAMPTLLPNNNSGIDAVLLPDGTLLVVYNPIAGNWAPRNRIGYALSSDGGQTFSECQILEELPIAKLLHLSELSYPAVIAVRDTVYITYTYRREAIRLIELRME